MFLFFAFGGVMVGKTSLGGNPATTPEYLTFLFFAALSFGASLAVNAWIFYRVTGGLFNPAVSRCSTKNNKLGAITNEVKVTVAFVLAGVMHPIRYDCETV